MVEPLFQQAQKRIDAALSRLANGLPVDLAPLETEIRALCVAVQAVATTDGAEAARHYEPALAALAEALDRLDADLTAEHAARQGDKV